MKKALRKSLALSNQGSNFISIDLYKLASEEHGVLTLELVRPSVHEFAPQV